MHLFSKSRASALVLSGFFSSMTQAAPVLVSPIIGITPAASLTASIPAFKIIPATGIYSEVLTVNPSGSVANVISTTQASGGAFAQSFNTIAAALDSVPNGLLNGGACAARYLVKLLPGDYPEQVFMKSCVDIEGWSEQSTTIGFKSEALSEAPATVYSAGYAELRMVTVINSGDAPDAVAINLGAGANTSLRHVTATAWGGANRTIGIYSSNSSALLTDVSVTATAPDNAQTGTLAVGILNTSNSTPTMTDVTAFAQGLPGYGMQNVDSSPVLNNVAAASQSGAGLLNSGISVVSLQNSILRGEGTSLSVLNSATINAVDSQFDGGVTDTGAMTCQGSYDGSYAYLNATCQ